jgi:hypothetical protein
MLKEGYDHFEVTRLEPKVDVCEKRYVFNAAQPEGSTVPLNFSPRAQCPVYEVPREIASAVAEKKKKDETALAELISRGTPTAPVKMATDGGMHEVFATALQGGRTVQGADGDVQRVATATPGTIPAHVNPPSNVLVASAPAAAAPAPTPAVTQAATPPRSNSVVARAPAQPTPRAAQAASAQPTQTASASVPGVEATRNFLNNLFTSNGGQTQTAAAAPSAPAQAAKSVDLRGATTAARPAAAQPAPVAKPKPTAVAEAKPMPLPESEEAAAPRNAGAIRPQSSPVSAFNGLPAANSTGLLSGAAPVVPSGSFGGGWR